MAGDGTSEWSRWDGASSEAPLRSTLCWQAPYRSLLPRELDNVLAAGRCIGADHEAAGAVRVMVNCMQAGEAAGVAASLADGGAVKEVPADKVREILIANGAPLDISV